MDIFSELSRSTSARMLYTHSRFRSLGSQLLRDVSRSVVFGERNKKMAKYMSQMEVELHLYNLVGLGKNWDGQGAMEPSDAHKERATALAFRLMWKGLYPVALAATAGDQVGLYYDFYAGQDIDIYTLDNGRFEYMMVTKVGKSWLAMEESDECGIEEVIEVVTTMRKEKVE